MPVKHKPLPPISYLQELYYYNPETGVLKNKFTGNTLLSSKVNVPPHGIFWKYRIIYAIHYGVDPADLQIDHIDGNRLNNKITNLRLATHYQNNQNVKGTPGLSGYKGVTKVKNKWAAQIMVNRKHIGLGLFDTPELAHKAYCDAADKHHKLFSNYG